MYHQVACACFLAVAIHNFAAYSCTSQANNNQLHRNPPRVIHDTVRLSFRETTVWVISQFIDDTVGVDVVHRLRPCSEQMLVFINGKDTARRHHRVDMIKQKTSNGDTISMLPNLIYQVGIIEGTKCSLLQVSGYGGCNSCPEWFGLYALNAELLQYTYSTGTLSIDDYGDYLLVLSRCGIQPADAQNLNRVFKATIDISSRE